MDLQYRFHHMPNITICFVQEISYIRKRYPLAQQPKHNMELAELIITSLGLVIDLIPACCILCSTIGNHLLYDMPPSHEADI